MKTFDIVGLWNEAERLKLLKPDVAHFRDLKNCFGFDCNTLGSMKTSQDARQILKLILLIRDKFSTTENSGEHLELLGQVALIEDLANSYVRWGRSYHMVYSHNPEQFITLRTWLAENGHPYPHDDK